MRMTVALAVACAIVGLAEAQESSAALRQYELNIPRQSLDLALQDLARQTGLQIARLSQSADGDAVVGPVSGSLTPAAALESLLEKQGLTFEVVDGKTIAVMRKGEEKRLKSSGVTRSLRLASTEGDGEEPGQSTASPEQAPSQSDAGLEEVVVTSQINFIQNDAFGATKMGLPLKDTPYTVLTINSDLIDVASVRSIGDLGKLDASGSGNDRDGASDAFYTRGGFQVDERVDGFRSIFSGLGVSNELAAFERVEIVKGGTSTVYGQGSPGGIVNYVSKLPQGTSAARFKAEAGSHDYRRLEGDLTGALFGSDKWSYRVIAAGQNDDTFRDYSRDDRVMVTPSLMYRGESASLILRAIYQKQEVSYSTNAAGALQLDGPLPDGMAWETALAERVVGLKIADIPRSRWLAPLGAGLENEVFQAQIQHDYVLPSQWKIRSNIQYATNHVGRATTTVVGPYDIDGNALGFEREVNSLYASDVLSSEVNIFGNFHLLGREHTLFFGIDYANSRGYYSTLAIRDRNAGPLGTVLNLFHPDYEAARNLVTVDAAQLDAFYPAREDSSYFGTTAQVILKPLDRLSILLGLRFSSDSYGYVDGFDAQWMGRVTALHAARDLDAGASQTVFDNFSKQAGITYALTDQLDVYASSSETFLPSTARSFVEGSTAGKVIAPPLAKTRELGLKGQFATTWGFSLALFDVKQDSVVPDLLNPDFSVLLPGWKSRGVEISMQGRFFEGLNVFASAAVQDAEYSRDPYEGMTSSVAPDFGLSLFGTYEILAGNLRGLGVGAGIVHKSGRKVVPSDVLNYADGEPFRVDFGDYTSVDARIFYNRKRWGAYGAVTNLTGEKHLSDAYGDFPTINGLTLMNPGRQLRIGTTFEF